jgi:hypothetical protein
MLILERDGITTRLLNNSNIIGTDAKTAILIMNNINYDPWEGDPHLSLAIYFRNHPELGVTVVRATEQAPYNPRAVY